MDRPRSSRTCISSDAVELCEFDELEDDTARGFDPSGEGRDALFVIRRGNSLRAYRNACPHQGASLPWRKHAYLNADATRIVCSAHGAQFDIDSGVCVLGAALGHSLHPVELSVGDDGVVRARWRSDMGRSAESCG